MLETIEAAQELARHPDMNPVVKDILDGFIERAKEDYDAAISEFNAAVKGAKEKYGGVADNLADGLIDAIKEAEQAKIAGIKNPFTGERFDDTFAFGTKIVSTVSNISFALTVSNFGSPGPMPTP